MNIYDYSGTRCWELCFTGKLWQWLSKNPHEALAEFYNI